MTKTLTKPKILFIDIETLPNKGYFFSLYDYVKPDMITQEKSIVTFSYKWATDKKVSSMSILDYVDNKKNFNPYNDSALVCDIVSLLNEADYVVGHYGDKFDMRFIRARALIAGLEAPAHVPTIDTYKLAKKYFHLNANRLDYLGKLLGFGGKLKTDWTLWQKCAEGDIKAIKRMEEYNRHDVELLEQVFNVMLPHVESKINCNLFKTHATQVCPACGSLDIQKRGTAVTKVAVRQRYQCQGCGSWFTTKKDK